VQRTEETRAQLRIALDELQPAAAQAVDEIAAGATMAELVSRTEMRVRRRTADALGAMTSALAENRVAAIRVVVDDEGMTITEAARLFGVPRQVLSRLYHGAR
jgi:hypothetical protein